MIQQVTSPGTCEKRESLCTHLPSTLFSPFYLIFGEGAGRVSVGSCEGRKWESNALEQETRARVGWEGGLCRSTGKAWEGVQSSSGSTPLALSRGLAVFCKGPWIHGVIQCSLVTTCDSFWDFFARFLAIANARVIYWRWIILFEHKNVLQCWCFRNKSSVFPYHNFTHLWQQGRPRNFIGRRQCRAVPKVFHFCRRRKCVPTCVFFLTKINSPVPTRCPMVHRRSDTYPTAWVLQTSCQMSCARQWSVTVMWSCFSSCFCSIAPVLLRNYLLLNCFSARSGCMEYSWIYVNVVVTIVWWNMVPRINPQDSVPQIPPLPSLHMKWATSAYQQRETPKMNWTKSGAEL